MQIKFNSHELADDVGVRNKVYSPEDGGQCFAPCVGAGEISRLEPTTAGRVSQNTPSFDKISIPYEE
jgi:hypothetical protein